MESFYKECFVTITTEKKGGEYVSIVKIISPLAKGTALLMMGESFPTAAMAEDYGSQVAREWIDENVS